MVCTVMFRTFSRLWATGWGHTHVVFFSVFPVDLSMFKTFSFFYKTKLSHEIFTCEISNQMVGMYCLGISLSQIPEI